MNRNKWLASRCTPKHFEKRFWRWFWRAGTYVRERHNANEDIRLAAFQGTCNQNFARRHGVKA